MDCLAQVNEDQKLSAISEPDFDLEAMELPAEGPLTFEFDVEVRPEFELPKWKGLVIEKPVREFSDADVSQTLQDILARRGRLVPFDGPAEPGDYITTNLTFKHGDEVLASAEEEVIRIRPVLSFRDGKIEQFDKLMAGVRGGETREGEAPNERRRPQRVAPRPEGRRHFRRCWKSRSWRCPSLTPELLEELGGFRDEGRTARRHSRPARPAVGIRAAPPRPAADHRGPDGGRQLGAAARPCCGGRPIASCSGR